MSELRKAAAKALEVMEDDHRHALRDKAIDALRAALAQPEQEPVAWKVLEGTGVSYLSSEPPHLAVVAACRPLYTTPPQRNTLPLSDDEIKCIKPICADFVSFRAGVRHAEREHGIGENK